MLDQLLRCLIQNTMNQKMLIPRLPVKPGSSDTDPPVSKEMTDGPVSDRVRRLVASLTTREKLEYIGGTEEFCIRAVPRLGIPSIWTSDATSGVRGVEAPVTTFEAAIAMAASWDRNRIGQVAAIIAEECRSVGVSILLAPGVNIARIPTCGRNFEYMGEDPYLAGEMAASYVKAAQQRGVLTTVKHFACNNSEYDRHKTDSVVDERTLREIYLPAFQRVVAAGTLGVMTAYNPVNGTYASEHSFLIGTILRLEWGFRGLVISDWNSLYGTLGAARHGVDLEMPAGKWLSVERLEALLASNQISMELIDQKILHILDSCERLGILDRPIADARASIGTPEHRHIGRMMAQESAVLLKNDSHMLPLDAKKIRNIVVVGRNAAVCPSGGGGSSYILRNLPGKALAQSLMERLEAESCVTVLPGFWWLSSRSRKLVRQADAVVVCTGYDHVYESEVYDRMWNLPPFEVQGIAHACRLNAQTVVVLHCGGACEMDSWVDLPKMILDVFYLGEFSADAIAALLLGEANPSGKLPFTIAHRFTDYESTKNYARHYARISPMRVQGGQGNPNRRSIRKMEYAEGLMVGYRQFDTHDLVPLFPFGFGLSYTSFAYGAPQSAWRNTPGKPPVLEISCEISNTGEVSGAEVVQLYVQPVEPTVFRPFQELKGFSKVFLAKGERQPVVFELTVEDFSYFDASGSQWKTDPGQYIIRLGSSSRDIRAALPVDLRL